MLRFLVACALCVCPAPAVDEGPDADGVVTITLQSIHIWDDGEDYTPTFDDGEQGPLPEFGPLYSELGPPSDDLYPQAPYPMDPELVPSDDGDDGDGDFDPEDDYVPLPPIHLEKKQPAPWWSLK